MGGVERGMGPVLELACDPGPDGLVLAALPDPPARGWSSPYGVSVLDWVRGELLLGRTWSVADTYLRGVGLSAVRFYRMEAAPR